MLQFHIRVILRHFIHNGSPQSGRVQNVCLVHGSHFLSSLSRNIKTLYGDPADLRLIVSQRVDGFSYAVFFHSLSLTEIKSSGQFAHDHHIKSHLTDLLLQRACPGQFLVQIRWAQICKQIQGFAQFQKSCLRPFCGGQFVPRRGGRIAADGSHQHCIRGLTFLYRLICQRNPVDIDGSAAHQHILKFHLMAVC